MLDNNSRGEERCRDKVQKDRRFVMKEDRDKTCDATRRNGKENEKVEGDREKHVKMTTSGLA